LLTPKNNEMGSTGPAIATYNNIMNSWFQQRFELFLKVWHFCNNDKQFETNKGDGFKLHNICGLHITQFQSVHTSENWVSIDESTEPVVIYKKTGKQKTQLTSYGK